MDRDIIFNGILCIIMIILLITYAIYVIADERKKLSKIKYYKSTITYETDWGKYCDMVDKQKRILFRKKMQLFWLTFLVKIKRLIRWN